MPAKKKPVINRKKNKLGNVLLLKVVPRLNTAPKTALIKKTLDVANRSAIVRIAKIKVPKINPICTADVICPNALLSKLKDSSRSPITALPANQREVQQNCEKTIIGKTRF